MAKRFVFLCTILLLAGCQKPGPLQEPIADAGPRDKAAPLTETATPNKPATRAAADVENEDLESLKAELNALNSDLSRIRSNLGTPDAAASPPVELAVPRTTATQSLADIPDNKAGTATTEVKVGKIEAVDAHVVGLRIGTHPDKKRLVIDLDGSVGRDPKVTLSDGKILKIQLFNTDWPKDGPEFSSLEGQLGVFKVTTDKADTFVTITLSRPAELKSHTVLPPMGPGGPQRLVIDLVPTS